MNAQKITVSSADLVRLQALVNSARQDSRVPVQLLDALEGELARTHVVEPWELPEDVVAMNSTVWFQDEDTGEDECYTLVYPTRADVSRNLISVLAPIGTALIGYRIGDVVQWKVPAGISRLRITKVQHDLQQVGAA